MGREKEGKGNASDPGHRGPARKVQRPAVQPPLVPPAGSLTLQEGRLILKAAAIYGLRGAGREGRRRLVDVPRVGLLCHAR